MGDPASGIAAGFTGGKILSAIAGLFGGLSISFFWQPKNLHQHGKLAAGAIVGGIAVAASFALGGVVASYLGVDINEADTALGIGYCVGVSSVGVISFLANFFANREGKDILEVAAEIKNTTKSEVKPTKKRVKK